MPGPTFAPTPRHTTAETTAETQSVAGPTPSADTSPALAPHRWGQYAIQRTRKPKEKKLTAGQRRRQLERRLRLGEDISRHLRFRAPHGRGNVFHDIVASRGMSRKLAGYAYRATRNKAGNYSAEPADFGREAYRQICEKGAGVCNLFGTAAAHLAQEKGAKSLTLLDNKTISHVYVRHGAKDDPDSVIIDPWGNTVGSQKQLRESEDPFHQHLVNYDEHDIQETPFGTPSRESKRAKRGEATAQDRAEIDRKTDAVSKLLTGKTTRRAKEEDWKNVDEDTWEEHADTLRDTHHIYDQDVAPFGHDVKNAPQEMSDIEGYSSSEE